MEILSKKREEKGRMFNSEVAFKKSLTQWCGACISDADKYQDLTINFYTYIISYREAQAKDMEPIP